MRLVLGLVVLACGCGARSVDARTARDALTSALVEGDAGALGRMTDRPIEDVAPLVDDAREELAVRGRALTNAPLVERARVYVRGGGVVVLVREDGAWRVDRGALGAPVLATPTEALEAFAQALQRVRGTHVTAVLARSTRLLVADELERWLRGLGDVSAVPIVIEGDRATATLPTGMRVDLVLEAGEWRVEDVHD